MGLARHGGRAAHGRLRDRSIQRLLLPVRAQHIARRDRQQRLLERLVDEGVETGARRVEDSHGAVPALITMCTGVAQWYRVDGPLSPEILARQYTELAGWMFCALVQD
ncbi:MAG: hypothetical protein ACK5LO_09620 [Leucobacter sp.]|uniref:hypothetical protein n=1 Tax=Microbacterium sp. TaxID=51671 RepID=UPI003A8BBD8E